jgi:hypothetical protein
VGASSGVAASSSSASAAGGGPAPTTPLTAVAGAVATSPALAPAAAAPPAADGSGGDGTDDSKTQKNRGRCWSCKKKVGLTGFECRCGFTFCGVHRYADAHACGFDYLSHDRAVLAKNNEKVVGAKLEKI